MPSQKPVVLDVVHVQQMLEALMVYHPFWLRLGLVVVLGDAARGSPGRQAGEQASVVPCSKCTWAGRRA